MDEDLPPDGVITNEPSANDVKEEDRIQDENANEPTGSSINSDLTMTLKSILVDDFSDKFTANVIDKSYQQVKSIIGHKGNRQYSDEKMGSIVEVFKIMLINHSTDLMNEIVGSNTSRIEAVFKKEIQTSEQNEQNLAVDSDVTIKSEHADHLLLEQQAEIVPNVDAKETIATEGEHINDETKNDEIFQSQPIDVDDLMTDEDDDVSNAADNDDDHLQSPTVNIKVNGASKLMSNTNNKLIRKCDDAILDESSIRIPNILKELEEYYAPSSNGDDSADSIENESTSTLHSRGKKSSNSTTNLEEEKEEQEEKDLFSLDDTAISNIDDSQNEEHSDDADFFQNPFNNYFGLDDLDQICGTTITGLVDDDEDCEDKVDDAKEDKDNECVKNYENEVNNESNNRDQHVDNVIINDNDNENNQVGDKFPKIAKLLKDAKKLVNSDQDDDDSDDELQMSFNLRKRAKRRLFSDDEGQDKKRIKLCDSDSSRSSIVKPRKLKKRKRVVIDVSSAEEDDNMGSDSDTFDTPNKSRKRIKKILSPTRLNRETVNAEKAERERRKRIEEKYQLYDYNYNSNQLVEESATKSSQVANVILDFNTKQALVEVDKAFVQHLKPHQVDGIKFLFDCTIETVDRLLNDDDPAGGGCILAHSMGLGKTFQVIAFLHTIMTNELIKQKISKVLIIVPYNVINNWANEFSKWFDKCGIKNEIPIHQIFDAKLSERADMMNKWHEKGGIMLIAIKLFSNLLKPNNKTKNKYATFKRCLIKPGPDMVIVDEGHLLKNDHGVFNGNVSQVKTLRRVILTGTPLQNNLSEYFTMVNFVKPQLLGTKKEFKNRFENPIRNGQHTDSTPYDVNLMKKRVHILHKLLKNCIHRCDYNVLVPYLKPKFEYVLSLRMTQTQVDMYKYYLENLVDRSKAGGNATLFYDYTILGFIWNHPALLHEHYSRKMFKQKKFKEKKFKENDEHEEDSMEDFIDDDSSEESDSNTSCIQNKNKKTKTRSRVRVLDDNSREEEEDDSELEVIFENKPTIKKEINSKDLESERFLPDGKVIDQKRSTTGGWSDQFLPENNIDLYQVELSVKFKILFAILEKSEAFGDKILIFSQSLYNLNLIERFLKAKMVDKYGIDKSNDKLAEMTGNSHRWLKGHDYFRIDGGVNCQARTSIVDKFNDTANSRARLMLVSTKAGGIGINLVGANRCIIFDASWNPSNDMQAIFRIFRYGQTKPVYVYRFTAFGTMESKIYERQIIKQSLSHRVVDEQQIQRHFTHSEISDLYTFNEGTDETVKRPNLPKDKLLDDIFKEHRDAIVSYHEHDSLLESIPEEELTEEERKLAWNEYETEKDLPPPDPLLLNNNTQFLGLGSSQISQIWTKRKDISNSLYEPSNLQQKNENIAKQEQTLYQKEANDFLEESQFINVIEIDKCKVFINLNTIINFGGQSLEYFEKEFFKLHSESEKHNVEKTTLVNSMLKYMEKCMDIYATYHARIKNLNPQALDQLKELYLNLAKGGKSLDMIHSEFYKKYKSYFNFPTKCRQSKNSNANAKPVAGPLDLTLPKWAIMSSLTMPSQLRSASHENIECITLSDDDD